MQDCLSLPLSGEPRLAYCYVHPRKSQTFADYVQDRLADQIMLIQSQDLIAQGMFGLGEPHPQLAQRVGDFTLILRDNYARTGSPGKSRFSSTACMVVSLNWKCRYL